MASMVFPMPFSSFIVGRITDILVIDDHSLQKTTEVDSPLKGFRKIKRKKRGV